jgi:hypothetical protein
MQLHGNWPLGRHRHRWEADNDICLTGRNRLWVCELRRGSGWSCEGLWGDTNIRILPRILCTEGRVCSMSSRSASSRFPNTSARCLLPVSVSSINLFNCSSSCHESSCELGYPPLVWTLFHPSCSQSRSWKGHSALEVGFAACTVWAAFSVQRWMWSCKDLIHNDCLRLQPCAVIRSDVI